ncbi:MAG TPA: transcriptional regulator FtrA [Allosphingosinicella sp.]|uniref:transcriptional regulator FtrA n=1 Tax=Allosphingosinicella sp. TaxID=2823234 RepID=UPI002ED87511
MAKHLVSAVAYDGLCSFEFGCVTEVFGLSRPELGSDLYDFQVCSAERGPLVAAGGIKVDVPHGLEVLDRADTIILPGWRHDRESIPDNLVEALRQAHTRGARIASICSGAFVLAAAGLLAGRRATTHWQYAKELSERYPEIEVDASVLYIDDGNIVTSAGSAAGLDMMLHLVRCDYGTRICNIVARRLVIPPHRDGGQAQFLSRPIIEVKDSRLSQVLEFLRSHATEEHRLADLAAKAAMSPRSFFRKFRDVVGMSPYEWLTHERVAVAKELLEETDMPVDHVAYKAGFGATETLRHHFRRIVGRSPAEYRRTYSGNQPKVERRARDSKLKVAAPKSIVNSAGLGRRHLEQNTAVTHVSGADSSVLDGPNFRGALHRASTAAMRRG